MVVGRSMELTLDGVLSDSYEDDSPEKALACILDNWVALYPEYESGWWEPFFPVKSECQMVYHIIGILPLPV